jgi:hypothetical protein
MDFKKGDILYYKKDYLKNIKKLLKEAQKEKNSIMEDYVSNMIYNVYTVEAIEGRRMGLRNLDGTISYRTESSHKIASKEEIKMVELKRMFIK